MQPYKYTIQYLSPIILEVLWLSTIFLVPLVYVGEYVFVSEAEIAYVEVPKVTALRCITALIVIFWAIESLTSHSKALRLSSIISLVRVNLKDNPFNLVLLSVIFFTLVTIITTLLSSRLETSLLGEIPGQDGYSSYTVICYFIIFLLLITHLRTIPQLRRLGITVVATGLVLAIIGFLQHFGVDLFSVIIHKDLDTVYFDSATLARPGLISDLNVMSRVPITTGNAVFAGSLLLMTILVTNTVASVHLSQTKNIPLWNRSTTTKMVLWACILSMQISSLIFTFSRGPWIATLFSLIVFTIGICIFTDSKTIFRTISTMFIAIILSIGISQIPTEGNSQDDTNAVNRLASVAPDIGGGMNKRLSIWKASKELITERPWFESKDISLSWARPLIGYGPDMYRYVFALKSPQSTLTAGRTVAADHAHNYFIHQTVEQGLLGLISSLALFASVGTAIILYFFRHASKSNCIPIILLISGLSILLGRGVEQMIGVARISDLTLFWVLLATTVTLHKVFKNQKTLVSGTNTSNKTTARSNTTGHLSLIILAVSITTITLLTWQYSIKYSFAAYAAGESRKYYETGDLLSSLEKVNQAINLAPEVPYYYAFKNDIHRAFIKYPERFIYPRCGGNTEYITCIAQDIYRTAYEATERQPLYWRSKFELANVAASLGMQQELMQFYEETYHLIPNNRLFLHIAAQAHIESGEKDGALRFIERSLKISETSMNTKNTLLYDQSKILREEAIELQKLADEIDQTDNAN